jgi:hypothetical protein
VPCTYSGFDRGLAESPDCAIIDRKWNLHKTSSRARRRSPASASVRNLQRKDAKPQRPQNGHAQRSFRSAYPFAPLRHRDFALNTEGGERGHPFPNS